MPGVERQRARQRRRPAVEPIVGHPPVEVVAALVVDVTDDIDRREAASEHLGANVERHDAVPARESLGDVQHLLLRIHGRVLREGELGLGDDRVERLEVGLPNDRERFQVVLQPVGGCLEHEDPVVRQLTHEEPLVQPIVVEPAGRDRP